MSHTVMLPRRRSDPITSLRWRQDVCSAATDAFGRVAARNCIHSCERLSQGPLRFVRRKLVLAQLLQEVVFVVASIALLPFASALLAIDAASFRYLKYQIPPRRKRPSPLRAIVGPRYAPAFVYLTMNSVSAVWLYRNTPPK